MRHRNVPTEQSRGLSHVEIHRSWISFPDRCPGDRPCAQWQNARGAYEEFSGAIESDVARILSPGRPVRLRYGVGNSLLQSLVLRLAADLRGATRIRSNQKY
jgi:hypothetical protein